MQRIGFRSIHMDPHFVVTFAVQCFDRDVIRASPYQLLRTLEGRDKLLSIPRDYMLVARVSLLIRGLARKLGYDISMAQLWKREARAAHRRLMPAYPPNAHPT